MSPNIPSDIRALTSLHVGKNDIPENAMKEIMAIAMRMDSMKILCEVPFKDKTLTELDVNGKNLGMDGALVVAEYLDDDNGAISSVNLLKNAIPVEQAQELVKIMQSKEKLITLCGLSGNEATLDFSEQGLGPGDAVLIGNDNSDMGALSLLNLASNRLCAGGTKLLAAALKGNKIMTELNISWNSMTLSTLPYGAWGDISGVVALADVIPDMRAMTSLDLSSNEIGSEGAVCVAEAIKVRHCVVAVVFEPNSCRSDHWFNCCCLLLSTIHRIWGRYSQWMSATMASLQTSSKK
jgi:Ran GTPase-activating protein (RanGAP) involved in mRNA processing and transport